MKTRLSLLLASALASLTTAHAAPDAYRQWAVSKWGVTIAGADNTRSTTWGETADPDRDGIPNLIEYLADTNPTARTPLSDVYAYSVPDSGAPHFRYPQLLSWQRTDDPDVRILCQTSSDLHTWLPAAPADLNSPAPANPFLTTEDTGVVSRGLRQVRYRDLQSIAGRPGAFMRLLVTRRDQIAAGPGIDPFTFTPGQTVATSSAARSSAITLGGFTGSLTITIPSGVTLFVNGVAQTGPTATVKAGDVLWMEATAPATSGVPRNYTLTIGTQSATWTFTTGTPAAVPDHLGTDSGYTPVETGVLDTGAAQISIPIVVAPGTAGMQPKLSINYSSQGGNGPLGVGFSLSGLSTISRVGRTVAQDGVKGGVNFDANDRFALDGQRLIAINGADGADGTEYRPEFDPTSRIRSFGTEGSGPQRWVVETKAGLKMEFGLNVNSRINPEGGTSALAWAIEKVSDTAGNAMVFSYDDTARQLGEMLVTTIAYTSNDAAGLVANQSVIFEYEDRPDARTSYVAGFALKSLKRMSAVESRAPDGALVKRVRRYVPTYQQAEISGASQITQVQETTTDGTQLPATLFDWSINSSADQSVVTNTGITAVPPFDHSPPAPVMAGDFNADGILDMFKMNDHFGTRQPGDHWIALGNGNGVFSYTTPVGDLQTKRLSDAGEGSRMRSCDINGDGKTDMFHLYYVAGLENFAALSRGDGTFQIIPNTQLGDLSALGFTPGPLSEFLMIDVNGDGRSDAVYVEQGRHFVAIGNGNGSFTKVTNIGGLSACNYGSDVNGGGGSWLLPGDYNGDGFADLLHLYYSGGVYNWISLSRGDGSFDVRHQGNVIGIPLTTVANASTHYISADFNGDGLTDVLCLKAPSNANGWLAISKGDGTFQRIDTVSGISGAPTGDLSSSHFVAGDFNGDGFTDVFHARAGAPNDAWMAFSKGDGTFTRISGAALGGLNGQTYSSGIDSKVFAGDYDGDGTEDILHLQYSGANYLARSNGFDRAQVIKVTNGHGGYTSLSYKPLTDSSFYTKGAGSPYPCYDMQAPMYVVSSITTRNGVDGDGFTPPPVSPVGEHAVSYQYEGAWSCLDGRGFQGFKAVETTDATSGIVTRTVYEDRPLYAGRAKHTEQRLITAPVGGSALISESDTTWTLTETTHATGRKTYFITEGSSVSESYEVNRPSVSALVKTATRSGPGVGGSITYDSSGNLLVSTTMTTDGAQTFTETVTNTYSDTISPTRWHLGRLATSSVTKTGPNPSGAGTVSLTRSSSFTYHPTTGLLTQEVIEPNETTLRQQKNYTHDSFGNILTSTISALSGGRGVQTIYTPDGRFISTTRNGANHTESKTYDPLLGNVLTQTGPNGLTTTWIYDAIGRPVKETRPDGTETRSFYRRVTGGTMGAPPRAVHYVRVQSSGSAPKTVWYDLLDREIKTDAIAFDGRTVSAHKVFNNRGEVTYASQPYFAGETPLYSTMLYDAVRREHQQTDPGNRVTKTTYDGLTTTVERNYNPAALTDFQKAVTVLNAMGWTVQSSQYLGTAVKTITRKYDPYGNLRFVTDPAGNATELRYDVRGNKTYMSEPNSGVSTFQYNGLGEITSQTNAAGEQTTFTYDGLGRPTTRYDLKEQILALWTYDNGPKAVGQLVNVRTIMNGGGTANAIEQQLYYDALGRPAATIEMHGFQVFSTSRGYDIYGRPDSLSYPTGFATRQIYNANGHLSEVQNAATSSTLYWRALQVNARGQVTQETLGNGIVTDRAFDANTGLIQGITSTLNTSGDVQNVGFTFDLIGNLTERRDKRFSTHFVEGFGYDTLNRLQTVSTTGAAAVTCAYNDLGNLTSRSDVGTLNYASSGAGPHALTSVTGSSGGALNKTCAYDVKGNRTTDGGTVLDYSSFNKPTRIRKGGDTLSFDYGPDRALYRQTIFHTDGSGATSQTVREYIGGLYEREITSEGLVRHIHHIAGGNGVVAIHTDERSATSAAQRTRFIHKDHLGSVDAITDSNGVVVERQSYDAWGRRRTVTHNAGTWTVTYPAAPGSAETHRGFTGHEMLDLVGLVHMGGRIYDPITARFLSPDPFVQSPDNLQNLNRYSYVLNNPLSYTDPSGFFLRGLGKWLFKAALTGPLSAFLPDKLWLKGFTVALAVVSAPLGPIASAAITGFGSAFSGTLLAGGSVGDALRAGLQGGVRSAVTAGISSSFGGGMIGRAIVSGVQEQIEGGKFSHGFFGAIRTSVTNAAIAGGIRIASNIVIPDDSGARGGSIGGTLSPTGGGKFANGAVTPAMSNALGDPPADFGFNDVTHAIGSLVNLPLALPLWAAGQISPTFGTMLSRSLPATGWGSGDHTGFFGSIIGDNNGSGAPGLLGVSMGLAHSQGIWGDRAVFEAGMKAHDKITGVNFEPDAWQSAGHTLGEGVGILMSGIGFGEGAKGIFGSGDGYGFVSGYRSGLTPNLPSYSKFGNNGGIPP